MMSAQERKALFQYAAHIENRHIRCQSPGCQRCAQRRAKRNITPLESTRVLGEVAISQ